MMMGPTSAEQRASAFLAEASAPRFGLIGRHDVLASLDAWLDGDRPCGLLLGDPGRGKSAAVSVWCNAVRERRRAEVVYVPISRRFETALERDALGLLYARLKPLLVGAYPSDVVPQSMRGISAEIAEMLRNGREPEDTPLLIVLDGADEAIDFRLDASLVSALGPGVHLLIVTASVSRQPVEECLAVLGWTEESAAVIPIAPLGRHVIVEFLEAAGIPTEAPDLVQEVERLTGGEPTLVCLYRDALARGEIDAARLHRIDRGYEGYVSHCLGASMPAVLGTALALVARAYGPLRRGDLAPLVGRVVGPIDLPAMDAGLATAPAVLVGQEKWSYFFANERLRQVVEASLTPERRHRLDAAFLEYGQEAIDSLRGGMVAPPDLSRYVLEFYRVHLEASSENLDRWMTLVSPEWLKAWAARDGSSWGFPADTERVRRHAARLASRTTDDHERASALIAAVRCALVEVSVFTLAELTRTGAVGDDDGKRPALGLGRAIADGAARAKALCAFARELSLSAREDVLTWAYAAARGPDGDGEAILAVAQATTLPRRAALAREAAERLRDRSRDEPWVMIDVVPLLPTAEGRTLLHEVMGRVAGQSVSIASCIHVAAALPELLVAELWERIPELPDGARRYARVALAGRLAGDRRAGGVDEALECVLAAMAAGDDGIAAVEDLAILAPHLSAPQVRRALTVAGSLPAFRSRAVPALAERLAAFGEEDEAVAFARSLLDEGSRQRALARLLPRLSVSARRELGEELVRWLDGAGAGTTAAYLEDCARALASAVEFSHLLDLARRTGVVRALAAVAAYAPPAEKSEAVAEVMRFALSLPDHDTEQLFSLLGLAEIMSARDASELLGRLLGYLVQNTRSSLLVWWNGNDLAHLAPLLRRAGGEAAVLGVAREIVEVAEWLP